MSEEAVTPADPGSARDALFARFSEETDSQKILKTFSELCEEIGLDPARYEGFFQAFKGSFTSWKACAVLQLIEGKAKHPDYNSAEGGTKGCEGKRVLVIGAGPVGLRAAVEAAFLGAKVDVVEKRTSFTRNNSLHLWPFLITDLKNLGAKKFYGRFCSSTIDHISIRILQSILLKACLIVGVKVHLGVSFNKLVQPTNANAGWTVATTPTTSPVTPHHFDIIIGADGKQNSMPGFHSKEFRAKLALAITANYVNAFTKHESSVPEISGVSYVYRQNFFDDLSERFGIELENIVYYKDETHYFVMTAKKNSLLKKGVLKRDHGDPALLLHKDNIDKKFLEHYANEAVVYSTEGALGDMPFEKNHRGENDVALFDFTSLFAAENAARIVERKGKKILLCLVGDSLLEPFWPLGTGCARGFLGVFDAAWIMKRYCADDDPLEILEERESILYLLPQTTPERLQKNHAAYSINPKSRYNNLSEVIPPGDISHLYDTDNSDALQLSRSQSALRSSLKARPARGTVEVEPAPPPIGPSHSRSIGEIASLLPASKPPSKDDAYRGPADSQEKAKHFWMKQQPTDRTKPSSQKSKPVNTQKSAPLPLAKDSGTKRHRSASPAVEGSPAASPKKKHKKIPQVQGKAEAQKKTEVVQRKPDAKKEGAHTPEMQKKTSELQKIAEAQKKPSSPKWFRQKRSKSESPEREKKGANKGKGPADTKGGREGHPLGVTAGATSGGAEGAAEETQMNVLDRIKQYNTKDSAVQGQAAGAGGAGSGGKGAQIGDPRGKKGKEEKGAEKEKGKKKEKPTKEKASDKNVPTKEAKKEAKESTKHWNPFKKSQKAVDKTKEGAKKGKDDGKKGKKAKGAKAAAEKGLPADGGDSAQMFAGVRNRIEMLRELGLETDGTDGDDAAVLVSVVQRADELPGATEGEEYVDGEAWEEEEEETGDEESADSEDEESGEGEEGGEEVDFGGLGPEVRVPSPAQSPVPDDFPELNVVDKVKKLQELHSSVPNKRPRCFTDAKRSKEIDLSELSHSRPAVSHPLWKVRIIRGLNKCLENLRKENDMKTAKTALVIINAIFSNVEKYPENDVFRRVRVSSVEFTTQVWQYSEAKQFLARSGWVQIDDVIVLPMGTPVETPKRVIEKHLSIINNQLWSMQLELPDSPNVVTRRDKTKTRGRLFSLNKRESYATMIVEESMEKISEEDDMRAMAAARVRRSSADSGSSGGERRKSLSPPPSSSSAEEGAAGLVTVNEEEKEEGGGGEGGDKEEETDALLGQEKVVPSRKLEEAQTIKAATAARKKWEAMSDESKADEYRQSLETELYGLPPSKLAESIAAKDRYVPSSYRRELSMASGIEDRIRMLTSTAGRRPSAEATQGSPLSPDIGTLKEQEEESEENEAVVLGICGTVTSPVPSLDKEQLLTVCENQTESATSAKSSPTPPASLSPSDHIALLTSHSNSATVPRSSSNEAIQESCTDASVTTTVPASADDLAIKRENEEDGAPPPKGNMADQRKVWTPQQGSIPYDGASSPNGNVTDLLEVPRGGESPSGEDGSEGNQAHQSTEGGEAPSSKGDEAPSSEGTRAPSPYGTDQLKVLTVASRPNGSSDRREMSPVRSEKSDYEKITMEAAALSREKWKQSEGKK